nr:flagellar brake domain-containing protein [Lysinibacillus timonensis]
MELKIGTALTLEPIPAADRFEKFHCKVVEYNERLVFIDYPINTLTKKTAFLTDGSQFRASFTADDNNSYAFNTEVVGRKVANIPMIVLSLPPNEEILKIQRREFVRVNTSVDVAVEYDHQFYQFTTEDISAGGLALILPTPAQFQEKDHINLTIVLPFTDGEIRYVKTEALVVRVFERQKIWLASIQFIEMGDLEKQLIVRYCFEQQLLLRRKEFNKI